MTFAQATPLIITGLSMFMSMLVHWLTPGKFWWPTLLSGLATAVGALLVVFLMQDNYLVLEAGEDTSRESMLAGLIVAGFGFAYGVIVSVFLGFMLKVAPSFFD